MLEDCKVAGLPEPDMQEQNGCFLITLYKNRLTEELQPLVNLTILSHGVAHGSKYELNGIGF